MKGQEKLTKVSRLEKMRKDRQDEFYEPELPPCDLPYLIEVLYDAGPVKSGGMGPVEIDEERLGWWQSNTGIELQPWESRMLKRLSRDYLSESTKATKSDCPPPWVELEEIDRPAVAKNIRAMLRG